MLFRSGIAAGYAYPFSKRTFVYTFAAYNQLKVKFVDDADSEKTKQAEFGLGLVHSF